MSLIMREFEWVEDMMQRRALPGRPYSLLESMARYYSDMGYNKGQIKKTLRSYILQCNPDAAIHKDYGKMIDNIMKAYKNKSPVCVNSISITTPELETINSIENKQARRVAFSLLCIAKFKDVLRDTNNHWVNEDFATIMKSANVRTSVKRQCLMLNYLRDNGLIEFAKRPDNNNLRVLFMQDGEEAMVVTTLSDLGYRYLMSCGEPYFECQECGSVTRYKSAANTRGQKYCSSCAPVVAKKQRVQSNRCRRSVAKTDCDENLNSTYFLMYQGNTTLDDFSNK